jgi:riboflavin kinase/FMN adenylyltransferase
MIQASSIEELHLKKACVTIGSFDGVHTGHRKLVAALVDSARRQNIPAVVITFFPHPAVVFKRIETPFYLSTPEEKAEQLSSLGVDVLISIPFSLDIASMPALDFIRLLKKHLGLTELVVGEGFALGKGRVGTVEVLSGYGRSEGYSVTCISPQLSGEEVVSSSMIRAMLQTGDVQAAATALGRDYGVVGTVEKGDGRGRTIGFPTANLGIWPQKLLPSSGVYRCISELDGKTYLSVANVGFRPTFTENINRVFVEVHLLDFQEDIYGRQLKVQFTHRLRGETKYPSFEELVQQINRDIQTAREL